MRKTARMACLVLAGLALFTACGGGGGGGGGDSTDAVVGGETAACEATVPGGGELACNPLCNTGCDGGAVCTYSGDAQSIVCQSGGTVGEGVACGGGAGLCAAGVCADGLCRDFCLADDGCPAGQSCTGTLLGVTGGTGLMSCSPIDTECKPLVQDCPEGEACYRPSPEGDWTCLAAGTGQAGNTCRAVEECGPGFACIFATTGDETGICRALCGLEFPGSAVGACDDICAAGRVLTLSRSLGAGACVPFQVDCDLITQNCPRDWGCYLIDTEIVCHEPGPGAAGDLCAQPLDCAPGLLCLAGEDDVRCRPTCALAEDAPAGKRCAELCPDQFTPVEEGLGLGACGKVVQAGECDLFLQNCDPGEACYPTETDPACFNAGFTAEDGSCNYANDCQEGLLCVGSDGQCHIMCSIDGFGDPACADCASGHHLSLSGQENLGVCAAPPQACDLLAQDCPTGQGCYPDQEGVGSCRTAGTVAAGAACESGNDCVPGTVCANSACLQLCDRASPGCPTETPNCNGVEGWEQLGVCTGG